MENNPLIYHPYKKAHLFFYSKCLKTNDINFLFFKKNSEKFYSTISTEVNDVDNAPPFSISRELTNSYGNLFTEHTIDKIISKTPLTKEDINKEEKVILPYKLWSKDSYMYWLGQLSNNVIQYDEIKEEVIYFIELPYISIEDFNNNLKSIDFYGTFEYVNLNNYSNYTFSEETMRLFSFISINDAISHIISTEQAKKEDKLDTYIVLACKKKGKDQIGFFHFPALFQGLYRRNNEKWIYLVPSADELPNEDLLKQSKCIIIPGSELSVYEDYDFLRKTEVFLKQLIEDILYQGKYPQLKILGICFGMEIVISALGGKIGNMGKGKNVRDPEKIKLIEDFWNLQFVKNSTVSKVETLSMCEAHGDFIEQWPDKYKIKIYGKSPSCNCEVMVDEKEKLFLVQGHPEYHPQFFITRGVEWYLSFEKKENTEENCLNFLNKSLSLEHNKNVNSKEWRQLCYTFMKKSS